MMPGNDDLIKEGLTWAQWWALPWRYAHEDWRSVDKYAAIETLYRNGISMNLNAVGIAPCLPPPPTPTLLRLVLASSEQLNLILLLIHCTFNPVPVTPLSKDHQLWCMRLSRALPPDILLPNDDPLQLLHNWVEPAIWQRLRLRFPYERVLEMEKKYSPLESGHGRLDTLWQAFVWRATTMARVNTHSDSNEQGA
ncbi:hypothetical protein [Pseudomonas sp. 24 R 17]|nr:hypothetical protein [Pseudomonas sp. 24 R 17]